MREVWLRTNRRVLGIFLLAIVLDGLAGMGMIAWVARGNLGWPLLAAGGVVLSGALMAGALIGWMWFTPRLAYEPGQLLVYVRGVYPLAVPIELVECFLLGQGPAQFAGDRHATAEMATLVVKLSDRAEEWKRVAVNRRLASWCDGYITLRGAWTEPLDVELVQRLNARLALTRGRAFARAAT